jgi:polysaccharide biosynthesis/export protein
MNSHNRWRAGTAHRILGGILLTVLGLASEGWAQEPPAVGTPQQPSSQQPAGAGMQQPAPAGIPSMAERLRPNYILQVGDQIMVRARDVEELTDRPFRIETDQTINLPLVGRIKAADLTVEGLEAAIAQALRQFVVNPQVSITVTQFKTDPVFVVGAFRSPGIYPLQGRRTLVELLTSVGGLAPNAGRRLRITRRIDAGKIPLPSAVVSPDGRYSSVDINIVSLQTTVNSLEDIALEAYDIISAERAEMIFTAGAVGRVGGIELGERESLSMLQALALAGGLAPNANASKAYVLRPIMNTARRAEIPIDLSRILRGEGNDVPLLPNDILYVPLSLRSRYLTQFANMGIGSAFGAGIFTLFNRINR